MTPRYQFLYFIFAVPNGGKRTKLQGYWLKEEGMKEGVVDIWCPIASGGYYGLVMELKDGPRRKATEDQIIWLCGMSRLNWRAELVYSGEEVIDTIKSFYGIEEAPRRWVRGNQK